MSRRVLVAYATRYGATAEVARAIATELEAAGLDPSVHDADQVRDLSGYDAVVFGTPLYFARVLSSGRRFLRRHRRRLATLPVAVFVLGVEPEAGKRRKIGRVLARRPPIRPIAVGAFGGLVDGERLRFRHKTPPIRKLMPLTDTRDWEAIARWAREVAGRLAGARPEMIGRDGGRVRATAHARPAVGRGLQRP